jgi:hypothetical protein
MARAASATDASAMLLITRPVDGSVTSMLRPEVDGTHSPPMNRRSGTRASSSDSDNVMIRSHR